MSLIIIMIINFVCVIGLKEIRARISSGKLQIAFDKNMEILMRINGFFIGAIGVDMIVRGIQNLF